MNPTERRIAMPDTTTVEVTTPRPQLGEAGGRCSMFDCDHYPVAVQVERTPDGRGGVLRTLCPEHLATAADRVAPLDTVARFAATRDERALPVYARCVEAHPNAVKLVP
jgi:hypothetical protein